MNVSRCLSGAILAASLLCAEPAWAGIVNGDFDTPPPGTPAGTPWLVQTGGPGIRPGLLNPAPAGLGANNYLHIGGNGVNVLGSDPSIVFQDFDCGNMPNDWCTVTFNAQFIKNAILGPNELALVLLQNSKGAGVWAIPAAANPGAFTVAIQPCDPMSTIAFALVDPTAPGAGNIGQLIVDNVVDTCLPAMPPINLQPESPGMFPSIDRGKSQPLQAIPEPASFVQLATAVFGGLVVPVAWRRRSSRGRPA
jgi:hypothetical protein